MTGEEPIQEQVELQFVADTRLLQTELNIAAGVGRRFASSLLRAFDGLANKGKSLGQVLRGLALDLSKLVLKAAFKPLQSGLGALFQGLFTGGAAFGSGGVLQQGTPVPTNDLWIAALVTEHGARLCTRDAHCGKLAQLDVA